jgi:sulfur carrier protein
MIRVVINGESRVMEQSQTVADYLESFGLNPRFVAVARNGEVLAKEDFASVMIAEGDKLEIVRPVGGG